MAAPVRAHVAHNKITANHGRNGFISKVQKCSSGPCVPRICSKRCGGKEMAKGRTRQSKLVYLNPIGVEESWMTWQVLFFAGSTFHKALACLDRLSLIQGVTSFSGLHA